LLVLIIDGTCPYLFPLSYHAINGQKIITHAMVKAVIKANALSAGLYTFFAAPQPDMHAIIINGELTNVRRVIYSPAGMYR